MAISQSTMWEEVRRGLKPSPTFCQLSNPFLIVLWIAFPLSVPGCRNSLFGPQKWSLEVKIAQGLARVSSVPGPSCFSWMNLGSRNKFMFFLYVLRLTFTNVLWWMLVQLNLHLPTFTVWISLSHSPDIYLPKSFFRTTNVSTWCTSRSNLKRKQNFKPESLIKKADRTPCCSWHFLIFHVHRSGVAG